MQLQGFLTLDLQDAEYNPESGIKSRNGDSLILAKGGTTVVFAVQPELLPFMVRLSKPRWTTSVFIHPFSGHQKVILIYLNSNGTM